MSEVIISKSNFESEVMNSNIPVLIDFWAAWCGPCKMLSPIIADIAKEYDGKVKVCKINVDDEPELASRFAIVSIPTVLIIKDGKVTNQSVGFCSKEHLCSLL